MYPTGAPIRVTLDETSNSRAVSCKPQTTRPTQVKILRRPNNNNLGQRDTNKLTPTTTLTTQPQTKDIPQQLAPYLDQAEVTGLIDKNNVTISNSKKTYQERADEYAKARLRILGSAFPDTYDSDDEVLADGTANLDNESSASSLSKNLRSNFNCPAVDRFNGSGQTACRPGSSNDLGVDGDKEKVDSKNFRNNNVNWLS